MAKFHIPVPGRPVHISKFMLGDLRKSGVYFLYHKDELVYVGQTRTLKLRLETHLAEGKKVFDAVAFIPCTIDRLLQIEGHYIEKYAPRYNACGKAKFSRQRQSWHPKPKLDWSNLEPIDAKDVEMNAYEAADFLHVPQSAVVEWQKVGLLSDLRLTRLLDFIAVFGCAIKEARSVTA